jgi:hypothetical protein
MTPMKRLSVKKAPNIINATKNRYMYSEFSNFGCLSIPTLSTASDITSIQPSNVA